MSGITPGPWLLRALHTDTYVGEEHVVTVERFIRNEDGLRLATIGGGALCPEAADFHIPNARLMAAAPELLASLEETAAALELFADVGCCDGDQHHEDKCKTGQALRAATSAIAKARGWL